MKYIPLFLFCILVACQTAPVDSEPGARRDSLSGANDGLEDVDSSGESSGPKPIESPSQKFVDGQPARETPQRAYGPLGEAFKNQNDEAIQRAAIQILSQNPTDAKALNALGLFHYRKGRFVAARYFFSRAAAASPKSGEVLNNQGLVSLALDEPREAIRYFKKALDLNQNDGIAAANLGSIYVQEKDYIKANIVLEIAVKNGMREVRTLNNYGIALAAAGKFDQARKRYEEALKISSNNHEALFNLATVLIEKLNAPAEGRDQLNRLRLLSPAAGMRNKMNALENKAKAGIK